MKTYYIVETYYYGMKKWETHSGPLARIGIFNIFSLVLGGNSFKSADDAENELRQHLATKNIKPKIVRVLKI